MKNHRPSLHAELGRLKDFQRSTVDYVFRRLYEDKDRTSRFLIADEVGLGKTLVARGLIAKVLDSFWNTRRRIDIVYICSNADIARQNVSRLSIVEGTDAHATTRITMLPVEGDRLRGRKVNLVSFTPGTSFDLASRGGRKEERAVLFLMLDRAWRLERTPAINVLRGNCRANRFRRLVNGYDRQDLDQRLVDAFVRRLRQDHRHQGKNSLKSRFRALCRVFTDCNASASGKERRERIRVIGELRSMLAEGCLSALRPDLIILDEFQRFKYLLDPTREESRLAQALFRRRNAKTVLLSATPYKMYTVDDERERDDHYEDFRNTVDFLLGGKDEALGELLEDYRRELHSLSGENLEHLQELQGRLAEKLRKVMVRTERLAVTPDRSGMLREVVAPGNLEAADVVSYVSLQRMGKLLVQGNLIELWKSAPYLLNFMESYQLKSKFEAGVRDRTTSRRLARALRTAPASLLAWEDIAAYRPVDPGNARLRTLFATMENTWKLLWIPPALPYYHPAFPFGDLEAKAKKMLVFSSWRVVPKVIATLLSYDVERRLFSELGPYRNAPGTRKKLSNLLRFGRSKGRLTGMPVFALLYPSEVLANLADPLALVGPRSSRRSAREALDWAKARIDPMIAQLVGQTATKRGADRSTWYWAAPLLLDAQQSKKAVEEFLRSFEAPQNRNGADRNGSPTDDTASAWIDHVHQARALLRGELSLGPPPQDLSEVLGLLSLAGPGIVTLRSLRRLKNRSRLLSDDLRAAAWQAANAMRRMFNSPESTAAIRGFDNREPFWRRTLEYCHAGCLQAVMDEYMHVLQDQAGLVSFSAKSVEWLVEAFASALGLRAASVTVDSIGIDEVRVRLQKERMRTRFAGQFTDTGDLDDEERITRKEQLRDAFNSPFWPFVLATTSVGQEGLDFHSYCHSVVHWNLPTNPVDLEQREGRVHRYKGHAVRKNLAEKYARRALRRAIDPWATIFEDAKRDKPRTCKDLVPFWVFQGSSYIERHLPFLPLGRDRHKFEHLRTALWLYRMVFGQARQQDLVASLSERLSAEEIKALAPSLMVDLSPPRI